MDWDKLSQQQQTMRLNNLSDKLLELWHPSHGMAIGVTASILDLSAELEEEIPPPPPEMQFIINYSCMSCENFELEFELLIIQMGKLTLNKSTLEQNCEIHNFGGKTANQNKCISPIPSMDYLAATIDNLGIHSTKTNEPETPVAINFVPELWEFSY